VTRSVAPSVAPPLRLNVRFVNTGLGVSLFHASWINDPPDKKEHGTRINALLFNENDSYVPVPGTSTLTISAIERDRPSDWPLLAWRSPVHHHHAGKQPNERGEWKVSMKREILLGEARGTHTCAGVCSLRENILALIQQSTHKKQVLIGPGRVRVPGDSASGSRTSTRGGVPTSVMSFFTLLAPLGAERRQSRVDLRRVVVHLRGPTAARYR
jgi:hypothetical protein